MLFKEVTFSASRIATALALDETKIVALFRDGRTGAAFAPGWLMRAFELPGLETIFVRVMTDKVNFLPSKAHGVGRKGSTDTIIETLSDYEEAAVVDVFEFPTVRFYLFSIATVVRWVREGELGVSGMPRAEFGKKTWLDVQRAKQR